MYSYKYYRYIAGNTSISILLGEFSPKGRFKYKERRLRDICRVSVWLAEINIHHKESLRIILEDYPAQVSYLRIVSRGLNFGGISDCATDLYKKIRNRCNNEREKFYIFEI